MTLSDYIQIEEILAEANAYGLKPEVIDRAIKIEMLHNMSKVDAYQEAYNTIIG
jgi:hypothetical protein|tara:strand:- start:158 stop:319 length:162 start_codon:yes stop_codon:yes gene_type:complete